MKNILFIIFLLLLSSGVALAGVNCNITGDGQLAGGDSLEGSAITKKNGSVVGTWSHTTSDGNELSGVVNWVECVETDRANYRLRKAFANIANFGGNASWNGTAGYSYRVNITDSGTPGSQDHYRIMVSDPEGGFVYRASEQVQGNIQIHSMD